MAETIEESYETEVRRKVVRTKINIEEVSSVFYCFYVTTLDRNTPTTTYTTTWIISWINYYMNQYYGLLGSI